MQGRWVEAPPRKGWRVGVILTILALPGLMVLLFAAWGWSPAAQPRESVALALPFHPSSLLPLVALDQDYFAARGLEVSVESYPSGRLALRQGLFHEGAEIAWAHEIPVALAGFERSDFRIIGTDLWADDVNKIVARRDRGIDAPPDLRGKRIGTPEATSMHYFLHLFLLRHNLSEENVGVTFLEPEALIEALMAGRIDAIAMREPLISEAQARLGERGVTFEAPGLYEQMHVMVAQQRLLEERPHIAVKVLQALLDAEAFVIRNPEAAAQIAADYLGAPVASVEATLSSFWIQVGISQALFALLESEARWAIETGLVAESEIPNYLGLIDATHLEQLRPETVTIIR